MNNKNFLNKKNENFSSDQLEWGTIQAEMKNKFGTDIYDSWLRKIEFVEDFTRTDYGKIKRLVLK